MSLHRKPIIKENHHRTSKIEKKKKKNTYADNEETFLSKRELIKQIDTELKHLKGQQNILQRAKQTWTNTLLSTNLKDKKIKKRSMSVDKHMNAGCNTRCDQVCKVLQKLYEKNCVKVTDSSTQIGSSFYHLNRSDKDTGQYSKEIEKHTKSLKNMNFEQSENFISNSPTESKIHKNMVSNKKVSPTRQSYRHENYSARVSAAETKMSSPVQSSSRSQPTKRTSCEVSKFLSRPEGRTRSPDVNKCHPNENIRTKNYHAQQESTSGNNVIQDQQTPINNFRTKRNISSSQSPPKRNRRTPSSTRRHAQLSKEISDYASSLTDHRASGKSDKQSTYTTKKSNREVSSEVYKKILESEKQDQTRPPEILKISRNVNPSYNISKTKTKFEKNVAIHKHNTFIIMNNSQSKSHNKEGKQYHHPTESFESSNNERESNSRTNNLSQNLGSKQLHYPNDIKPNVIKPNVIKPIVIKPNVIDDTTYVCPDNSEENDYLILPYINTTMSEDNDYLNLSPKPAFKNLGNRETFLKEKSAVILEDISSHESQVYCLKKFRSRAYNSHHEHPIKECNDLTQTIIENKVSRDEISSQYDRSEYMSHVFEKTWDSHTNYRQPRSSKFETSHDLRIQTSKYHRSPYYSSNDKALGISSKRSSQKHSTTISPEKDEINCEYERSKMTRDPISKLRSHQQHEPKEQFDQKSDKSAFQNGKQEDIRLKSDFSKSSKMRKQNGSGYLVTKEKLLDRDPSRSDTGKANHFNKVNQASTSSYASKSSHDKSDLRTSSETREQNRWVSDQLLDIDSSPINSAKIHRLQKYEVSQASSRSDFENDALTKPPSNYIELELDSIEAMSFEPDKLNVTASRKYELLDPKNHSLQSTNSSRKLSVKSALFTPKNHLNIELIQDLKENDSKTPLSPTKQMPALGAISKKDCRSKSIVSAYKAQKSSIENEILSSGSTSYESRKKESKAGTTSKERSTLSLPKLNQSKRSESIIKPNISESIVSENPKSKCQISSKNNETISSNGLLLGAISTPSLEEPSVREINHDTENHFESSSEKTTSNVSLTPQRKFTYSSNEFHEPDSKEYKFEAQQCVLKEVISLTGSKHILQEKSPLSNKEQYFKKNSLQNSQLQISSNEKDLGFYTTPKVDTFSPPTEWKEQKNEDFPLKTIRSDLNASSNFDREELFEKIARVNKKFESNQANVSKSKLNDPELGAISKMSYNKNDLDLNSIPNVSSFQLSNEPKVLKNQKICGKPAQCEPALNTSTSEMLWKIEPNVSSESIHNTSIEISESSEQYKVNNGFESKKLTGDDTSIVNDVKEPSASIDSKAVSQRYLPTKIQSSELFWNEKSKMENSFRKSERKLKPSISLRNSSGLTFHKEIPVMKANFPSQSESFSSSFINLEKEVPDENAFIKKYSKSSGNVNKIEQKENKMADLSSQSEKEWLSVSGVVQKRSRQFPSNDLQLQSSNEFEIKKIDKSSLNLKSNNSLKESKSAENAFLSDTFNQNVPIEGVPLEVSYLIQHLQNRVRDCDENVKKQLREFEIQKKNCQIAVQTCTSGTSRHIKEDDDWEPANVKDEAFEELTVSSDSCDKLVKEDLSESEIEGEISCHCILCGEEKSTSFVSEEIPSFKGCDCMREDYYGIMRIAYKK